MDQRWNVVRTAQDVAPHGCPTGTRRGLSLLLAILCLILSCTDTNVSAVDVARLELTPESLSLLVGETASLVATVRDANGNELRGRSIAWSSSAPEIARVDDAGRVSALAPGSATIRASSEGASDEAMLDIAVAPIIAVDRDTVRLSAVRGGSPPPVTVLVRNDGSGTLDRLSVSTAYAPGQPGGWLDVALRDAQAPTILLVGASTATLKAGEYDATVTLASPAAERNRSIAIVLDVGESPPSITLGETAVGFGATAGGVDPSPKAVLIQNGGGGTLQGIGVSIAYGAGQPGGWLDASLDAVTAPASLTLGARTGALAAGQYTATVLVSAPGATNSPRTIDIRFDIEPQPPEIDVTIPSIDLSVTGSGSDPSPVEVTIGNGGGGQLTGLSVAVRYSDGEPTGWLDADLSSTSAPSVLTVQASTAGLPQGSYTAFLDLDAAEVANPVTIPVALDVQAAPVAPAIALSPASLSFQATAGGSDPTGQNVTVNNSGTGTLNGLGVSVEYASGQPTGWLSASLDATTAPATIDVQPSTGSLGAGTYSATVRVTSSVATNSPQAVNVTFTIAAVQVLPAISLSPTSLAFDATAGGANPAAKSVSVANSGGGTLNGLAVTVDYASGQPTGWLSASLDGTTAPATIDVQPSTGSLGTGTYSATVRVTSSVATNSPQAVNVTFTIAAVQVPPAIALSPASLAFDATAGGSNPVAKSVSVANSGGGTLNGLAVTVEYGSGQPTGWLSASLNGTTAPATISVQPSTGSLAAGTYSATIRVTSSVASNSPQAVNVTFTVEAAPVPPAISLSPTSLAFDATAGGSNPVAKSVSVANSGGGTLNGLALTVDYTSGQPTGWLSASLDGTTAPATISVQPSTGSLAAGTYSATVRVTSSVASNSPQAVSVTFTVAAVQVPPAISLSPTSLSFDATAGGSNPAAKSVSVTNSGGGTLNGLGVSVEYASGQPTGWLSASLNGTTAPATISIQSSTGSLVAGTYNATIRVTSSVASNSPQTVSVTFTVAAPAAPRIVLSTTSLTFEAIERQGNPATQKIHVNEATDGSLGGLKLSIRYAAGQPTGWLNASLNKDRAPALLDVSPKTGQLAVGTYDGIVEVSSGEASNSPQTVQVTFIIRPATDPGIVEQGPQELAVRGPEGGFDAGVSRNANAATDRAGPTAFNRSVVRREF